MSISRHNKNGHVGHRLLQAYSCLVAGLCQLGLAIATVLLLLDTLIIGVNIVLRYLFHAPFLGTEELVSASLILIVMLSAPEVLRRGNHIGVDILVGMLSPRWARVASLWASVAVLLVAVLLITNGWKSMQLSRLIGALTEGYIEIPVWALQFFLPVGGVLLALAALEQIFRPTPPSSLEDMITAGDS